MAWLARHIPARDQAADLHHQRHRIHEHEPAVGECPFSPLLGTEPA